MYCKRNNWTTASRKELTTKRMLRVTFPQHKRVLPYSTPQSLLNIANARCELEIFFLFLEFFFQVFDAP